MALPLLALMGSVAGASLQRILASSRGVVDARTVGGAIFPWCGGLVLVAGFLLPREIAVGAPLGAAKHVISASYLLGVAIFSSFLLPPLLASGNTSRIAAGMTLVALLISIATGIQPPNESDEGDYVVSAIALATTGTTRVDRVVQSGAMRQYYGNNFPSTWRTFERSARAGKPPHSFSLRASGYPLILLPFVALGMKVALLPVRWYVTYLAGLVAFYCYARIVHMICLEFRARSSFTFISSVFSLPILYYVTETLPELWMALGTAACVLLASRAIREAVPRETSSAAGILSIGLLILHERMLPVTLVISVWGLVRAPNRTRYLAWALTASAVLAIASASPIAYRVMKWLPGVAAATDGRVFTTGRIARNALAMLFLPAIGLFAILPSAIIAIPGLLVGNRAVRLGGAIFGAGFALMLIYPQPWDSVPHGRFLIPYLPALIPALTEGERVLDRHPWGRRLCKIALAVQLGVAWPFLAAPTAWRSVITI